MQITTKDTTFVPIEFAVYPFCGTRTCFCWNERKFVLVNYTRENSCVARIHIVPHPIKQIQCCSDRIFLVCVPEGVYEFTKDKQIVLLSKDAISIGSISCELLILRNQVLCVSNTNNGISKELLSTVPGESAFGELCTLSLNTQDIAREFLRVIAKDSVFDQNVCIIAYNEKLFKLIDGSLQLIYADIYSINQILPILSNSKVSGLTLLCDTNIAIVIYAEQEQLRFSIIRFGTKINAICVGFTEQIPSSLWMVYCSHSTLFYAKKALVEENFEKIKVQNKRFVCLRYYDSNMILGLTNEMQLCEFSIEEVERALSLKNDAFIPLHRGMLRDTELTINKISREAEKLHALNEELLSAKNQLRRINLYAHKGKIRTDSKLCVQNFCNKSFITVEFTNVFPENSRIVLSLHSMSYSTFCSRKVIGCVVTLDLPILENIPARKSTVHVDMIAISLPEKPWCLLRDCVSEILPVKKKRKSNDSRVAFINAKLATLKRSIEDKSLDMKKLFEMKCSIRKVLDNT